MWVEHAAVGAECFQTFNYEENHYGAVDDSGDPSGSLGCSDCLGPRRERRGFHLDVQRQGSFRLGGRGGKPGDFELRLSYKLEGGNSGIQFRSKELPEWDTYGYQADMDAGDQWTGALFEHERGGIAMRGEKVTIDRDGTKHVTRIGDPKELAKHVKKDGWNDYVVIAKGPEITLKINGVVMAQAIDHQEGKAARSGVIALQMHPGPPMKVRYKNLRIKEFR
jgi:hypothetical protein